MTNGRLERIHDRELSERRRSRLYQLALAAAIVFVIVALAMAARSILFTIH